MSKQDELINSIIASLKNIPPLNTMRDDINILKKLCVDMVGTNGVNSGKSGFVPAPTSNDANKFLRSDGTWQTVLTEDTDAIVASSVGFTSGNTFDNVYYLTFDNTYTPKPFSTIYRAESIKLINNNKGQLTLEIGNTSYSDNVCGNISLCSGIRKYDINPPLSTVGSTSYNLPRYNGKSVQELTSVEYVASSYYNKTESDSKYLNKTSLDTAVGINVYGTANNGTGGLRFLQPNGAEGSSVIFRNDGSDFYVLTSATKSGGWQTWNDGHPLTINLSTGLCNINGIARRAKYDERGYDINSTYARLNESVTFEKVGINSTSSKGSLFMYTPTTMAVDKQMKSTADITTNNAFVFRNTGAGTSATPPAASGTTTGSIYLQYM